MASVHIEKTATNYVLTLVNTFECLESLKKKYEIAQKNISELERLVLQPFKEALVRDLLKDKSVGWMGSEKRVSCIKKKVYEYSDWYAEVKIVKQQKKHAYKQYIDEFLRYTSNVEHDVRIGNRLPYAELEKESVYILAKHLNTKLQWYFDRETEKENKASIKFGSKKPLNISEITLFPCEDYSKLNERNFEIAVKADYFVGREKEVVKQYEEKVKERIAESAAIKPEEGKFPQKSVAIESEGYEVEIEPRTSVSYADVFNSVKNDLLEISKGNYEGREAYSPRKLKGKHFVEAEKTIIHVNMLCNNWGVKKIAYYFY
ncbi:MAG: hypothetical protein QXU88_02165 [Candidatus Woesearchaeota archaeon]